EPIALGDAPERSLLDEQNAAAAVFGGIEFHHYQNAEVIKDGRDGGHPDHLQIGDLEELRDQEGRSAQYGRRDDGAEAARRQQPSGGIFLVAGFLQQRIGNGADRDGGGDARARRPAQQERGQHHRTASGIALAAHGGERKVDEE